MNFKVLCAIILVTISISLSYMFISNQTIHLTFASSFDQSLQKSHDDLQSAIGNQVQQIITDTIGNITNNSNLNVNKTSNNQVTEITSSIYNTPVQRVTVGDIDMAYKSFGNGDPILLISGSGNVMDVWPTYLLEELSKDHKVFIFDNRGVGNTTSGTEIFSIDQFANDTAGLMKALRIQNADVLGFSMGSFVAQQLVLNYPEVVKRLILYGASCGGPESIPQTPQVVKVLNDFINNRTDNSDSFLAVTFPSEWIKNNPNFLETIPKTSEIILSSTIKKQFDLNEDWLSKNWTGVCDQLMNVTKPTMIITGTEDVAVPSGNSVVLVNKIPGAWLVQIQEAGHGLMYQYPIKFTNMIKTFLNVTEK